MPSELYVKLLESFREVAEMNNNEAAIAKIDKKLAEAYEEVEREGCTEEEPSDEEETE